MKKITLFSLAFIFLLGANAQTNTFLTNDVPIGNRNISFIIKDPVTTNRDNYVFSGDSLLWVLHNTTRKDGNVHWQKLEHTFSLKLFDNQYREVPFTDYGKEMNSGPKSLPITGSIHLIALSPGQSNTMDFPPVDKLFQIPKPGEYMLEARYWYIEIGSHGQWKLSDPVRLKVVRP